MAELEQGLEELKVVKQAFKENINANNVSTSNVEFRNMPNLLKQMEKKLPTQTKSVEPTKYPQIIKADAGYKLEAVGVREIPSQYIIPNGTKEITENNEYDVTEYSRVKVAVEGEGSGTGGNPKFSQLIDGTIKSVEESDLTEPTRIKDYTFYCCAGLTSAVIPSNITSIGASAFEGCSSLQTLVLNDGVQSIGASAFKGINASEINIPSTISVLESEVFADNIALTSIVIPNNITEIKDDAFYGCNNLSEVTVENQVPPIVSNSSFPATITAIYVKYGAYESYLEQWLNYADKIVRLPAIPSTIVVTIDNYLGEKVGGAVVTIEGNGQTFTGNTDSNGVFIQGDLQPATYTISVADMDGFKTPDIQELKINEGTQNNVSITYLEKPAHVECDPVFANNSWATIDAVSAEISANNLTSQEVYEIYGWNTGDTKSFAMTTGENIEVRIDGFNHDDKSDGSGKAGITLEMTHCLNTEYRMNSESNTVGGFSASLMRTETLPMLKKRLPQDLQNVIKFVDKKSANGAGYNFTEVVTTSDDLFLLSEIELTGGYANSTGGANEGYVYEYWDGKTNADRIKNLGTSAIAWWLRSCSVSYYNYFGMLARTGIIAGANASKDYAVSFAFCI